MKAKIVRHSMSLLQFGEYYSHSQINQLTSAYDGFQITKTLFAFCKLMVVVNHICKKIALKIFAFNKLMHIHLQPEWVPRGMSGKDVLPL